MESPVPIIILSGFLGAGKTTVLKHILETSASDVRLGCVVNDLAKVNVDEATLSHVTTASQASFVSLASGCVCCDGGAGFASSLDALNSARVATDGAAAAAPFDAIVVECTGVADPQRAALDFASACAASKHAWTVSLELPPRVVTVVDGVAFWAQWDSSLREATGKRPVHAELLAKQVEVAHALVLNKASELRSERECTLLHRLLRSMNRDAAIVRVDFGRVDMSWLLTASTQQEQQQQRAPTAPPPPSRYGISSFVYTNCNRPLHPLRLMERVIKTIDFICLGDKDYTKVVISNGGKLIVEKILELYPDAEHIQDHGLRCIMALEAVEEDNLAEEEGIEVDAME